MAGKQKRVPKAEAPAAPYSWALKTAAIPRNTEIPFDITPASEDLAAIGAFLDLRDLNHLRFKGVLIPVGEDGWQAKGRLTAEVKQSCVVTLAPVPQKIDEPVLRSYAPEEACMGDSEIDVDPEADDELDSYTDRIDLGALLVETLALALEPYPRTEDAILEQSQFAPPGVTPLQDKDLKPFAKLAALKDTLSGGKT